MSKLVIVSYRGPNQGGGVSAAIGRLLDTLEVGVPSWLYSVGDYITLRQDNGENSLGLTQVNKQIVEGHYRFCNEYLWPIFHEQPQLAHFRQADLEAYALFNVSMSNLAASTRCNQYFVHDYQLMTVPNYVGLEEAVTTNFFWHIPWPRQIALEHAFVIKELVIGMLRSTTIGFHTRNYADNFLGFVEHYLPQATVQGDTVLLEGSEPTKLIVAPLGVDNGYWQSPETAIVRLPAENYIISVDRCDYSKGIVNRLMGIEWFFENFPERLETVSFLQVCTRSRQGLEHFDEYWQTCRNLAKQINARFSRKSWEPIIWLDAPMDSDTLKAFYRGSSAILITSLADGLNLTAKEYALSQTHKDVPGIVILSSRAGAFAELSDGCIPLRTMTAQEIGLSVERSLNYGYAERKVLSRKLQKRLEYMSIRKWWQLNCGAKPLAIVQNEALTI
jgi:trehalose 6-phosphate synthase/phosphatase